MEVQQQIAADLKTAMLAGDKPRLEALKMLKSALQYKMVELGARETGLTDEQVVAVLSKEAKNRLDAATMYEAAGNTEKAASEKAEHTLISQYLPVQLTDAELKDLVEQVMANNENATLSDMGRIIGAVKAKAGNTVDGSRIAEFIKQKLSA